MIKKLLIFLLIIFCHCDFTLHSSFDYGSKINTVYFSHDISMVVFASTSNTHKVYYFPGMTLAHSYPATVPSTCAKFSPNNLYVAFALNNYKVVIKDTSNFDVFTTINSSFNQINQIGFSPDSNKLIICGKSSSSQGYEIWDLPPGTSPLKSDYNYNREALACRFASDGSYAVGDIGGNTHYYSSTFNFRWKHTLTSGSGTPSIQSLAFAPNASLLAIGTSLQKVYVFINLSLNSTVNVINRTDPIISLDFTNDGKYLATGQIIGEIFIFDASNNYAPQIYFILQQMKKNMLYLYQINLTTFYFMIIIFILKSFTKSLNLMPSNILPKVGYQISFAGKLTYVQEDHIGQA